MKARLLKLYYRLSMKRLTLPKISLDVSHLHLLLQLLGALAVLIGISWWSIPCALIIGGIGAIVVIEMQSTAPKMDIEMQRAIQSKIKQALAAGKDPFAEDGVPLTQAWVTYAASLRKQLL